MRSFTLKLIVGTNTYLLTNYNNSQLFDHNEPYSTFNEKLVESENDQFELTFSMAGYVYDHCDNITGDQYKNYWLDLVKMGSKLQLILDDYRYINLIVNKVVPIISAENIIYQFTAQDEVSFLWSRHRLGYSYSTIDKGGVRDIFEITTEVLEENYLNNSWQVTANTAHSSGSLLNKKITLEVTDSNPYNVIIEACSVLNCCMFVNYEYRYITFYEKTEVPFSGYRYRPEIDLSQFSANYDSNNFTSLMHVVGGTNEYGEIITLVPAIPTGVMQWLMSKGEDNWKADIWNTFSVNDTGFNYTTTDPDNIANDLETKKIAQEARDKEIQEVNDFIAIAKRIPHLGQFLLDFDYFTQSKLLKTADYNSLMSLFNNDMLKNNIFLKFYTPEKYKIEYRIAQALQTIETLASSFEAYCLSVVEKAASGDSAINWSDTIFNESQLATVSEEIYDICMENDYQLIKDFVALYGIDKSNQSYYMNYEPFQNYSQLTKDYDKKVVEAELNAKALLKQLQTLTEKTDREDIDAWIDNNSNATLLERTTYTSLQSKLLDEESKVRSYKTLGTEWTTTILGENYSIPGMYIFIIDAMSKAFIEVNSQEEGKKQLYNISNINETIATYENNNNMLWRQIYMNYGQYIYESKYENADELDSVSLYNQGVTYFEAQKFPTASYSLTTIDLGAMELIGLPRLSIGSKIKIYNKWFIDENEISNINYRNNELVTTQITYDLRNAQNVQVSVDQITPYSTIVQKLLQSVRR